jgi:hypothetical protein
MKGVNWHKTFVISYISLVSKNVTKEDMLDVVPHFCCWFCTSFTYRLIVNRGIIALVNALNNHKATHINKKRNS